MTKKMVLGIAALTALVMGTPAIGADNPVGFDVGIGYVLSPGYNDTVNDAYADEDVSGGYGWLDFHAGLPIKVADQFSIRPGLDLLLNGVSSPDDDEGTYINTIIIPAVKGRFNFTTDASFFVEGGLNYGIPNSGGDRMEFSSGGVGFSLGAGYEFDFDLSLSLSYLYVPVETEVFGEFDLGKENFGGFSILAAYEF